jgi:hypothetical protein
MALRFMAGGYRPVLPASRHQPAPTRLSAWRSCTTPRSGTTPACDLLHQARSQHPWHRSCRSRHAGVPRMRAALAVERHRALSARGSRGHGKHQGRRDWARSSGGLRAKPAAAAAAKAVLALRWTVPLLTLASGCPNPYIIGGIIGRHFLGNALRQRLPARRRDRAVHRLRPHHR